MPKMTRTQENGLTPRQKNFIACYVVHMDGIKAASEAGYTGSKGTLQAQASNLLKKPAIAKAIQHYLNRERNKKGLSRYHVLKKVKQNLDRDLTDLCDKQGIFHDRLTSIPKRAHAWIDGFEVKQLFADKDIEGKDMQRSILNAIKSLKAGDENSDEAEKLLKSVVKGMRLQIIKIKHSPCAQIQDMAMRHKGLYADKTVNVNAKVASLNLNELTRPCSTEEDEVDPVEQAIIEVGSIK